MTTLTRWTLVLAATAVMGGACGGTKLGGTGGMGASTYDGNLGFGGFGGQSGGAPGTGGFIPIPGTGGFIGTGGYGDGLGGTTGFGGEFGTGGFGGTFGTGGDFGYGGSYGTGGSPFPDGGTCSAPSQGPFGTADSPRPFGWTFSRPPAGAPTTTVDGGTIQASCQAVAGAYPGTDCEGMATLEALATGTVIAFPDGSKLTWDGTLPAALMPYVVQQAGGPGETVWVHYHLQNTVVCPFCGAYTNRSLEIRSGGATGKVRFFDQQGDVLPSLTPSQIMDIFGTTATQVWSCTFPAYVGCYSFLRSEFDEQLATTPPQTILDATLTKVTTPNGIFQVIWASSAESYVEQFQGCTDGPAVATDTGFVASLLAP